MRGILKCTGKINVLSLAGYAGRLSQQKNPSIAAEAFLKLWCGPGLNRRHMDFQSIALPTELPHLLTLSGLQK